jgi:hypothetical protein
MCDDVELCNRCIHKFLILAHTWFVFGLPSKTGWDSNAACFDHRQKRLRCAQQPPARKSRDLDDLMSEDLPERDPRLSVDLPDHTLATERSCTQGKGAVARLALGEVVWLGHGTTLPSLTNKGFQPWHVHHIHPVLGHHDYQLVAVATDSVATDSVVSVLGRSTRITNSRAHSTEAQAPQQCAVAHPGARARVVVTQQGRHSRGGRLTCGSCLSMHMLARPIASWAGRREKTAQCVASPFFPFLFWISIVFQFSV